MENHCLPLSILEKNGNRNVMNKKLIGDMQLNAQRSYGGPICLQFVHRAFTSLSQALLSSFMNIHHKAESHSMAKVGVPLALVKVTF